MVFIKKEGVYHEQGVELRTQYPDLGNLSLVPLTLSATKGALCIELKEEIKIIYALHHCNLEIFPKQTGTGGSISPQEAFTKVAVALNNC